MNNRFIKAGWTLYYGWVIVGATVLAQIAGHALPVNSFSLFLREWSRDLHVPISQLLLALSSLGLLSSVWSPLVGYFADKWPARWLVAAGLLLMVIFDYGVGSITRVWQLWALYGGVLTPAISLCASIVANAVVSRWFIQRRGLALGIAAFGAGIGGVVVPPLIAGLMPLLGWREVWRLAALVILLIILPLTLVALRDRPTEREGLHFVQGSRNHDAASVSWRNVLKRRNFWLLVAAYLPILALQGGAQQNLAPIAASHGLGQSSASILLSIVSLAHIVAVVVTGACADRFGVRIPFFLLAICVAVGGVLIGFGSSFPALAIGCVLVGLGAGFYTLLPTAAAAEFGSSSTGRVFGMLMIFVPLTGLVPPLIAKVQEVTGSYGPGLLALSVVALVGGLLALLIEDRGKISLEGELAGVLFQETTHML